MAEYDRNTILANMLESVPATIDKREGSVIYNTLSPVALALAQSYYMFGYMSNLLFSDTSEDEWLDRVTSDFGIDREQATYSTRQVNTFDGDSNAADVPLTSRFAINEITFALTEKLATGQYKAVCEQSGTQGDLYSGAILPVDNINGLGSAVLVADPLIPARDIETDDSLRARFYAAVRQVAFGGNIADYEQKTLAVDGVGSVKVFNAVDMGAGNVGLIIGDEQGNTATQTLIDEVQVLMGTNGDGVAPIGHTVTVATSTDLNINVAASVLLKSGASFAIVKPIVEQAISDYISSVGFTDPTVFYAKLVAQILNSHDSILDVGVVTMNSISTNISLTKTFAAYQVPVIGTVTVTEVA